jgi:hypothetical protein
LQTAAIELPHSLDDALQMVSGYTKPPSQDSNLAGISQVNLVANGLRLGRAIVEMGIEVPPFIAAPFRADELTSKLRYFNGGDVKSLVIGATIRQPKSVLAAMHGHSLVRICVCMKLTIASSSAPTGPREL